jgi:transcriptional/translational regulatory protein YebC/TACO1
VHGLLEDIAHVRLVRSVVIVKVSDLERVLEFLEKYDAEIYTRDIILTPEDEKILNKATQ